MRDKVSRLGRLVSGTHHSRRKRGRGRPAGILSIAVEMIINVFRDGFANAGNPLQLAETGPGDGSRRTEAVQHCPLAPRPDPGDLIEHRAAERLCSLSAVRAYREAMRLVAQALQKVEHGVPWVEREWRSPGQKEALAPGVAVGPLGDRADRDVVDSELVKNALRDIELSQATVDQHEIRPDTPVAFGILLKRAGEAALQHLPHHRVIVAARYDLTGLPRGAGESRDGGGLRRSGTANREFPIGVFDEPVRARDNHGADRIRALDVAVVVDLDAVERTVKAEGSG